MSENLNDLISHDSLCRLCGNTSELVKSHLQRGRLPLMFATLPESITKSLNIIPQGQPQVEDRKLDDDGNVTMRPYSQPKLATSYRSLWLLFPAARLAETRLRTRRYRSEKEGMMYM